MLRSGHNSKNQPPRHRLHRLEFWKRDVFWVIADIYRKASASASLIYPFRLAMLHSSTSNIAKQIEETEEQKHVSHLRALHFFFRDHINFTIRNSPLKCFARLHTLNTSHPDRSKGFSVLQFDSFSSVTGFEWFRMLGMLIAQFFERGLKPVSPPATISYARMPSFYEASRLPEARI
jgi:hypothetical protein